MRSVVSTEAANANTEENVASSPNIRAVAYRNSPEIIRLPIGRIAVTLFRNVRPAVEMSHERTRFVVRRRPSNLFVGCMYHDHGDKGKKVHGPLLHDRTTYTWK